MNLENKVFYIMGINNKKSIAFHIANALLKSGAQIIYSCQNTEQLEKIKSSFPSSPAFICDVENKEQLNSIKDNILNSFDKLDGFVHSIAFAKFDPTEKTYLDTSFENFSQALQISAFSFTQVTNNIKGLLKSDASLITISISDTKATSYGYMGPIKALLESSVGYLAKALSQFSSIRVNAIGAGPLKTSASAGIPNYIENYLYAEKLTLRKKNLETKEVADTALFLLSPLSSGINAQTIIVDAGMSVNTFDESLVKNHDL